MKSYIDILVEGTNNFKLNVCFDLLSYDVIR